MACPLTSQNIIIAVYIQSETISLPVAKQIYINLELSISYQYNLTTDSLTNEWDAPLSNTITVLWGYWYSLSQ